MSINLFQYDQIRNLVLGILQQAHNVDVNVRNFVAQQTDPNVPNALYVNPLSTWIQQFIPQQYWQAPHAFDVINGNPGQNNGLRKWVNDAINNAMQLYQQEMTRRGGVGFNANPFQQPQQPGAFGLSFGGGGGQFGGGHVQGTAGAYDTGVATTHHTPTPPSQIQAQETRPMTPAAQAAVPTIAAAAPAEPLPTNIGTLNFTPAGEQALGGTPDCVTDLHYNTSEHNQQLLSVLSYTHGIAENEPGEVLQTLYEAMPIAAWQSYFLHVVHYRQLVAVELSHEVYEGIREKVVAAWKTGGGWRGVLQTLGELRQGEYDALSTALVARINQVLARRMRLANRLKWDVALESFKELADMYSPTTPVVAANHPSYRRTLDAVVERVLNEFFLEADVVGEKDPHFGDFIHCRKVMYYTRTHGTTKYDYGVLNQTDRGTLMKALNAKYTVLRANRVMAITNTVPDASLGPIASGVPLQTGGLGYYDALMTQVSEADLLGLEDILCLRKGLHPGSFLLWVHHNRTLDNTTFLTASKRSVGW